LLLADIKLCARVAIIATLANAVDLEVHLRPMVVTHLTRTGDSPLHVRRMPSTNARHLPETLVRLPRQLLGPPSTRHALVPMTLGHGDRINHLILFKNTRYLNRLLEQSLSEIDLVGYAAAVDLNLHQVGFFLLERGLVDLGVGEDADDGAVLFDALELAGDARAGVVRVLLRVLCKGLLLGLVPVLVEAALDFVGKVLGPHGSEGAEAAGGFDVADETNDHHLCESCQSAVPRRDEGSKAYRGCLNDCACLHNLFLVHLRAGSVKVTDDCGHAGLVTHRSREVDRLFGVILGKAAVCQLLCHKNL